MSVFLKVLLVLLAVACSYAIKCDSGQSCLNCLQEKSCTYFMTKDGGRCGEMGQNHFPYISKARSTLSCTRVEGIVQSHHQMNSSQSTNPKGSLPQTLPLVGQNKDSDSGANVTRQESVSEKKPAFSLDEKLMRKGFSDLRVEFLATHCKLYVLIFKKIHPKSNRAHKEFNRCMMKM